MCVLGVTAVITGTGQEFRTGNYLTGEEMAKAKINPQQFGTQVSKLLKAAHITSEVLAEKSGLDVERVRSIESGTVEKVTKKDCKRIGKVLQIPTPVVQFLGVEGDEGFSLVAEATQAAIIALVVAQSQNGKKKKKK